MHSLPSTNEADCQSPTYMMQESPVPQFLDQRDRKSTLNLVQLRSSNKNLCVN